jgi:hypothetical protein
MTNADLDEIQLRCDRASSGPWRSWIEGRDHTSGSSFIQTQSEDIEMTGATEADYDFIAHARTDIPRLLEEVMRLRGIVAALSST